MTVKELKDILKTSLRERNAMDIDELQTEKGKDLITTIQCVTATLKMYEENAVRQNKLPNKA